MYVLLCDVEFAQETTTLEYYVCACYIAIPGVRCCLFSAILAGVQQTQHKDTFATVVLDICDRQHIFTKFV